MAKVRRLFAAGFALNGRDFQWGADDIMLGKALYSVT
jgi:hypothetical protein